MQIKQGNIEPFANLMSNQHNFCNDREANKSTMPSFSDLQSRDSGFHTCRKNLKFETRPTAVNSSMPENAKSFCSPNNSDVKTLGSSVKASLHNTNNEDSGEDTEDESKAKKKGKKIKRWYSI